MGKSWLFNGCLILFVLVFSTCNNAKNKSFEDRPVPSPYPIKYAKGFQIQYFNDYKKLIINAPYPNAKEAKEYIISNKAISNLEHEISSPIKSIVVTSTTHIPMLELLNVEDKLKGFPNTDYVSSEKTRKLIDEEFVLDLGHEEQMNTELLLELDPDLVIGFSMTSNNKMFETIRKTGIPVILNGDWLEETPLGRAEWIRFFGVLFDLDKKADSIFLEIEKNYIEAKKIAKKAKKQPTIISGGLFKEIWNMPAGESFEATFLKDANADYIWKKTKGNGSLSLNIENVYEQGSDADLWISPSYYSSMEDLGKANYLYSKFKAFKNNKVYTFVNKKGSTGGIKYFELAPARPDLVLKDIIKIAHPNLYSDYNFTFFELLK